MKKIPLLLFLVINVVCYSQIPTDGLVAYWNLNGTFNDSGPFGINGTNHATNPTTDAFGVSGNAMVFSNPGSDIHAVSQYAVHPADSNLNFGLSQDFSVDFNIYIASPNVHAGGIYSYGMHPTTYSIWSWEVNGYLQIVFNFTGLAVSTTNNSLNYNTWYHVTTVKSGASMKIYLNGILNNTGNIGLSTPNYTNAYGTFGSMVSTAYTPPFYSALNGKIDEFRIYNRALTADEMLAITELTLQNEEFNDTTVLFYPNPAEDIVNFAPDIISATIVDISGKQLYSSFQNSQLDVKNLRKGTYFIKYLTENKLSGILKLIKK
jgi:hypothetical protein